MDKIDETLISRVAKVMGSRGGKKSKRKLTTEQAKKMVEARKEKHD